MTSFKKLLLATSFVFAFAQTAQAGIHIEPYLNYAVSGETTQGATTDDYGGGPIIGGRLGYGMLGFFIAADYEMGTLTQDSTPEVDVDQTNLGVSLGYEFPILLRVYGTYFFNSEAEATTNKFKGSGTRIGVGYTGLPFVAINFEMTNISFDEVNGASLSPELEANYYTVGLSLPLNF